ncbi:MAG TPA: hypothetical protein VKS20_13425 [Candidatus Acidoferrales bacterium]|nr:hypothetical protein [Candidatus Acidoferrales bacterium]
MRITKSISAIFVVLVLIVLAGCAGNSMNQDPPQMGNVFTLGTDAQPTFPSVVSFQVMITGITVNNAGGSLPVLQNPVTIDFARFSGLHDLLDLQPVPNGSYSSLTISGSTPVIGFLDTTQTPPALNSINGTPGTFSVTVPLAKALVVDANDLVGLLIDLDLAQTIQTQNGQVTGTITPTFDVRALTADDSEAEIDDFRGSVTNIDTSTSSFAMDGGHGRSWTVVTNTQTSWDDGGSFSALTTNSIVEVSGKLDRVTHEIDADEVEIVSQDHFFVGGLATYVNPPTPAPATELQLYVRSELPDVQNVAPLGAIDSFALNGSEKYFIADFRNPLTTLLFNNMTLAPGQRLGIGGSLSGSGASQTLTVHRVVLGRQGQEGSWVAGSTQIQSGDSGTFQINDDYLAGILLPQPLTVISTQFTNYVNLSGLSALSGTGPFNLRIVGFILVNQQNNQQELVARRVELLN